MCWGLCLKIAAKAWRLSEPAHAAPMAAEEAIRFSLALAARGVQIISGLAYGIDAWEHHGALEGEEKPLLYWEAVWMSVIPVNYPLYRRILQEGGGILSEFEPGTRPEPWHFPIRNRIISGLADLVLVIEASKQERFTDNCRLRLGAGEKCICRARAHRR